MCYPKTENFFGFCLHINIYSVVENLLKKAKEEFPKAEAVFRDVFEKKDKR